MRDNFAALERPSWHTVSSVLGFLFLVVVVLAYTWSGSAPVSVSGVVQSAGAASYGRISGGTQQVASVLLSDGTIAPAYVASGGLVAVGDNVRVLKERRLFGGSTYQIVAKNSHNEP